MRPATRQLGQAQAALMAIGGVLGAGLFIGVGDGLRASGGGLIVLFAGAAALAGVVTRALGSLALAQGGSVSFVATTARHLGARTAFVQGWGYWGAAVLACMAQLTAAGTLIAAWMDCPPWVAALSGLVLTAALNRSGVDLLGTVESWLSAAKIAVLAPVVVLAVASALRPASVHAAAYLSAPAWWAPHGVSGWLAALPLALFAFGNVELIRLAAADLADAGRTLAPTIVRVVLSLAALYIGVATALLTLLPPQALDAAAGPFALVLARNGLPNTASVMNAVLVWVMISSCNACLYGATRVLDALAAEGCAPAALMQRNAQGAPSRATALTTAGVGVAVVLSAMAPGRVFLPLLAGAAMLGLLNWSLFLLAHGRLQAGWRAWPDTLGLVAIALALALMAVQPAFHAAAGVVAVALAALIALSRGATVNPAGPGTALAPSGPQNP